MKHALGFAKSDDGTSFEGRRASRAKQPRVNLIIRAPDGSWRRRYGMAYDDIRLILEYDGRQHAEDTHQWLTDISRREELDQIRWRLVIITSDGIYREPLRTLERVRDALRACGAVGIRENLQARMAALLPDPLAPAVSQMANVCGFSQISTREPS